jgi:hypothetical protein
LVSSA